MNSPQPESPDGRDSTPGSEKGERSAARPDTPETRVDRWHRKLLDLTLRNRLLNFRSTRQTIPLICHDPAALEDGLEAGKRWKLVSLTDDDLAAEDGDRVEAVEESEAAEDSERSESLGPEERKRAISQVRFAQGQLCAALTEDELSKRLTKLYRRSRNDLAEGGSNTLYLAIGFLKWKESPNERRLFSAPLILVPARLQRRHAKSPYYLVHHEDDVRFNATLIQKLKRDFGCDISDFEERLPRDEQGVDVFRILEDVRRRIQSLDGFEVVDESALAAFSFAKYLMWKDLVDRSDQLEVNRVVRHLVHHPEKSFENPVAVPLPLPSKMDADFEPRQLVHPLDADSSQLSAVMAASQGHDFVLLGPPGTGKSQTITNMIAQCLARGKTVLFVAEKTAALDVVQRRLQHNGLGDFCVELHSNKAERKRFLEQLDRAWKARRGKQSGRWDKINASLMGYRDHLNAYVRALHQRRRNGWTAFEAMGASVEGHSVEAPVFHWDHVQEHDARDYESLVDAAEAVALAMPPIAKLEPMPEVTRSSWSMSWERDFVQQALAVPQAVDAFRPVLEAFCQAIGIGMSDASRTQIERLYQLASQLSREPLPDFRSTFDPQLDRLDSFLDRLDEAITRYDTAARHCGATYDDGRLRNLDLIDLQVRWDQAKGSVWPLSWIRRRSITGQLQEAAKFGIAKPETDLECLRGLQLELKRIDSNPLASRGHLWRHRNTKVSRVRESIRRGQSMKQLLDDLCAGRDNAESAAGKLETTLSPLFQQRPQSSTIQVIAKELVSAFESFDAVRSGFLDLAGGAPDQSDGQARGLASDASLTRLKDDSLRVTRQQTFLQSWTAWQRAKQGASLLGLKPLVDSMESGAVPLDQALSRFRIGYVRWWLPMLIDSESSLRDFQRHTHEDVVKRFGDFDQQAREAAEDRVRRGADRQLPSRQEVPRKSEWGLLRHQIGLKRPSKSIREVISLMPDSFSDLAPCLLMSPLSIAQYLPANQRHFDVVIFDEASQITTWDAIGAIARGKQTIIVGDPKQLPPTNFFANSNDDDDDETLEDYQRDLESILDEAKASGLPVLQLNWHYRSRHESLIAFSNHHYYEDGLVTFPSPETRDSAVRFCHLPNSQYDRGKTRTNPDEAARVVEESVSRMRQWLNCPEQDRKTLGIVTFNSQQQTLIQDMLDQTLSDHPELEWFFSDERIEPTVVKNLENVQGDERDVMLFSITFGPDPDGRMPLTFGALNRDGGERRLNVAITRARAELLVFCSFRSDQLPAERSRARGVQDLKQFIAYAEGISHPFLKHRNERGDGFGSELEAVVAEQLTRRGWEVVPQIGVSGFRIAMAVKHPQDDQRFLAGIECDGANYRDCATARDRDLTRQLVLRNLGWEILRVWSREWCYDASGALDQLDQELRSLLSAPALPAENGSDRPSD